MKTKIFTKEDILKSKKAKANPLLNKLYANKQITYATYLGNLFEYKYTYKV